MQLQVAPSAEMKNKAKVSEFGNVSLFALFSLLSKAPGASETRIRLPKTKMTISEPSFKLANLNKINLAYLTLF